MSEYDPRTHRVSVVDDHTGELSGEAVPRPAVCGWCFTDRGIVWTSGSGEFVGIARAGAGPRKVWRYRRHPADMTPFSQHPIAGDGYVYFTQMSLADGPGLMCFGNT